LRTSQQQAVASGRRVISGTAAAALFCATIGLISAASAQTIGSSYTSTAPRDCRVTGAGNGVDDSDTGVPGQSRFQGAGERR
jgi:hypothetical protein